MERAVDPVPDHHGVAVAYHVDVAGPLRDRFLDLPVDALHDGFLTRCLQDVEDLAAALQRPSQLFGAGERALETLLFLFAHLAFQVGECLFLKCFHRVYSPSDTSACRSRRTASAIRDFTVPIGIPSRWPISAYLRSSKWLSSKTTL